MSIWHMEMHKCTIPTLVGDWYECLTQMLFDLEPSNIADLQNEDGLQFEVKARSHNGWVIWGDQFDGYDLKNTMFVLWKWKRLNTDKSALYKMYTDPNKLKGFLTRRTDYGLVIPGWFIKMLIEMELVVMKYSKYRDRRQHWYYFPFRVANLLIQPYLCNGEFKHCPKWDVHTHRVDREAFRERENCQRDEDKNLRAAARRIRRRAPERARGRRLC